MSEWPLVTIVIATINRPEDLAITLQQTHRQDYANLEMIVIDDASTPPIEPVVLDNWPGARVIRHETNLGMNVGRNEGIRFAKGAYILQLDDDSHLVSVKGISSSVDFMEAEPRCAGIAYRVWNGREMPNSLPAPKLAPEVSSSFHGAGAFLRKSALQETAGYRELFNSYGEEAELSLQLLKRDWRLFYRPDIAVHHRVSSTGRNSPRAWKLALRNKLWTVLIHIPVRRIPIEFGWKVALGTWDAVRLGMVRALADALVEFTRGSRTVWRMRDPLDKLNLRRYDALRAYGVLPPEIVENPPVERWTNFRHWASRWRDRGGEDARHSRQASIGKKEGLARNQ